MGLGVALTATFLSMVVVRRPTPVPKPGATLTFRLGCLSPAQAIDIIRMGSSKNVVVSTRPKSPLGVIDVTAPPEELDQVQALIERYDNRAASRCGI
jgi:hypothetical protein